MTRAYQELATKNAKKLDRCDAVAGRSEKPTEFIELQQRLIKEGVEAAVSDSQHIAQLTTAVFTAAFEPVKEADRGGAEVSADLVQRIQVELFGHATISGRGEGGRVLRDCWPAG